MIDASSAIASSGISARCTVRGLVVGAAHHLELRVFELFEWSLVAEFGAIDARFGTSLRAQPLFPGPENTLLGVYGAYARTAH